MKAVLFSGGIDSLVHLRWAIQEFGAQQVQPVYFDVGQKYADREIEDADYLCEALGTPLVVKRPMRLPEDPDTAQVEFRNVHMILWATQLIPDCDGVVFGMLKGEAPPDKTPRFVRGLQRIIRDCRAANVYGEKRAFDIHVPFADFTKAEMLRWYIERWPDGLWEGTAGCFAANLPMCGRCWSCFNRWLAWAENGLPEETFAKHPADALVERLRGMRARSGDRQWRGIGKAWARRRWLVEAYRQVEHHQLRTHGRHALGRVLGAA